MNPSTLIGPHHAIAGLDPRFLRIEPVVARCNGLAGSGRGLDAEARHPEQCHRRKREDLSHYLTSFSRCGLSAACGPPRIIDLGTAYARKEAADLCGVTGVAIAVLANEKGLFDHPHHQL